MAKIIGKRGGYLKLMGTTYKVVALISLLLIIFIIAFLWWNIFVKEFFEITRQLAWIFFALVFFIPISIYSYYQGKKDIYQSRCYFSGLKGECEVGSELEKILGDEYTIFPDVKINELGNIDFVVIGPTGVFTLEVKNDKGDIEFDGDNLTQNGAPFEKNILGQAMSGALPLHDFFKKKFGKEIFVTPVIVFADFKAKLHFGMNKQKKVYVIGKGWLQKFFEVQQKYSFSVDRALLEEELTKYVKGI